jgi:aryl-alcohol dehydrogenase-like predicted oxidoreductase
VLKLPSRIGLGTNRLQNLDDASAAQLLRRAVELGVAMIDTADVYGGSESERRIGASLPRLPRRPFLATKGGMIRPDGLDGSPRHLRAALRASLGRLGVERVDLYYLHRPDPRVPVAESVRALAEMRDEGLLAHVGVSNVTLPQLEEACDAAPIAAVQNRYHLGDRASEEVLRACERRDVAFVPWYPLDKNKVSGGIVERVARRRDATGAQVALAWLLQRSRVVVPIPGTTSVAHLEEDLGAQRLRLSPEDVAELDAIGPG